MKLILLLLSIFNFTAFADHFITVPNDIIYKLKNGGNNKFDKNFTPLRLYSFVYSKYGIIQNKDDFSTSNIDNLFKGKVNYLRVSLNFLEIPQTFKISKIILKKGKYRYAHNNCGISQEPGSKYFRTVDSGFTMRDVIFHLIDDKGKIIKSNKNYKYIFNRVFLDGHLVNIKESDNICNEFKDLIFDEFFSLNGPMEYRNLFK